MDGWTSSNRHNIYYSLMWVVAPGILFIFIFLFGSDSYQAWWDRFDYWLTNKYLFSHLPDNSIMGPLWRDDILCGNICAGSLHTTPWAIDLLLGKYLNLSPVGIDLAGSLALYIVSIIGMYLYLRHVIQVSVEGATLAAVMFGATIYWSSFWHGSADFPMAAAWLPLLLYMSHAVEAATRLHWSDLLARIVGFAFLCFASAANSSIATWSFVPITLALYILVTFGRTMASMWNCVAASLGFVLYLPHFWQFFEAAGLSARYKITETGPAHAITLSPDIIANNLFQFVREIATNHNVLGLSLPAKLGLVALLVVKLSWNQEPSRIARGLRFAAWVAVLGLISYSGILDYIKLKMDLPILGGFAIGRFGYFASFGVIVLIGWTFDRCLINRAASPLKRNTRLGLIAFVGLAILTVGHIAYVASQMNLIPSYIVPQNYVLWGLFSLYAVCTASALWFFYLKFFNGDTNHSVHLLIVLLVLAVSLDVSVHAYRRNVSVTDTDKPISYADRYRVSNDFVRLKGLGESYGRAITLAPFSVNGWSYRQLAVLAIAGIPTSTGYNTMFPNWYQRLVTVAINGRDRSQYLTEVIVDDNSALKPELLSLLNVGIILTQGDNNISGYSMATRFDSNDTAIHLIQDRNRLGPAFVSHSARCFGSDDEALQYIRNAPSQQSKSSAPLVMTDARAAEVCKGVLDFEPVNKSATGKIVTSRSSDHVTIEVDSGSGILTLADTFYPGWIVFVDGEERPVLRTYTALRGVQISAGPHTVEFIYRPTIYFLLRNIAYIVASILLAGLCLALLRLLAIRVGRAVSWSTSSSFES
jgi:hypothetical protein